MSRRVETRRFDGCDPAAKAFYDAHGYVIVRDALTEAEREVITPAWQALVDEAAEAVGMPPADFEVRFPQNRDLWTKSKRFESLLFESRQAEIARRFLDTAGVRLFHDHAIAKPARASDVIPWHQDSSYWPVDRVGNSVWTPTAAVSVDGGCLKVLDGSHRDGPGVPQDFLDPDDIDRDADPRVVHLPVERGESVVLHGLTWHGSDPNRDAVDRLAYLTLWVPSSARFAPAHAGWHPTAAHVEVEPGERLAGAMFPLFGALPADDDGEPVAFQSPEPGRGRTMFEASTAIKRHLRWLAGWPDADMDALVCGAGRAHIVDRARRLDVIADDEVEALARVLEDFELQERIRRRFVARDVYLTTVQRWWDLMGPRVEARCR